MRFLRRTGFTKRRFLVLLAGISLAPLTIAALAVWAGMEVASPQRRPLHDYHREFLAHPQAHGLRIVEFALGDQTPCLLCEPAGAPGKRGSAIREELREKGIKLLEFGEIRCTLVLLHGRRGRKEDYLPIAERLCACGFRCLIPDLPGHGDHPMEIATYGVREAVLPERLLAEASERFGFMAQPAGLLGMSMGGSVAMHAASCGNAPWLALVIVSSFDSLAPVIERNSSGKSGDLLESWIAGGASLVYQKRSGLSLDSIRPADHAALVGVPTLIAHGTGDNVIPIEAGRRLFDALPEKTVKRWIDVPGADHHNVLVTDFPIYAEIAAWMLEHVDAPSR